MPQCLFQPLQRVWVNDHDVSSRLWQSNLVSLREAECFFLSFHVVLVNSVTGMSPSVIFLILLSSTDILKVYGCEVVFKSDFFYSIPVQYNVLVLYCPFHIPFYIWNSGIKGTSYFVCGFWDILWWRLQCGCTVDKLGCWGFVAIFMCYQLVGYCTLSCVGLHVWTGTPQK